MLRSLVVVSTLATALLSGLSSPAQADPTGSSVGPLPECYLLAVETPTKVDPYVDVCRPQP